MTVLTHLHRLAEALCRPKKNRFIMPLFWLSLFLMENPWFGKGAIHKTLPDFQMIDMRLFSSPARIVNELAQLGSFGRQGYLRLLVFDLLLLTALYLLQTSLLVRAGRPVVSERVLQWLLLLPAVRALADVVETGALLRVVSAFPQTQPGWTLVASLATPVKWLFMFASLGTLLVLGALCLRSVYHAKRKERIFSHPGVDPDTV